MRGNKSVEGGRERRRDLNGAKVRPDEKELRESCVSVAPELSDSSSRFVFLLASPFHPPVLSSCFLIFVLFFLKRAG